MRGEPKLPDIRDCIEQLKKFEEAENARIIVYNLFYDLLREPKEKKKRNAKSKKD